MGNQDKVRHRSKHVRSKGTKIDPAQYVRRNSEEDKGEDECGTLGRDIKVSCVVASILLIVYTSTLHPSVPGGDSGELIVSAYELGVAHPPGYPLFTMVGKLFMTIAPFGSPAFKLNMLNAMFSAIAGGFLLLIVLRVTGCVGSALLTLGLFSINKLTWTWSVSAEVFGLNNLFISLLMFMAVMFESSDDPKHCIKFACLGAFVSGLSLCNQHTIVVYIACLALWVVARIQALKLLNFRVLMKLGLCFTIGLLPYVYLPISSHMNVARWTWGSQKTIDGFLTHLLRKEYGTFDLGKDAIGGGLSSGLMAYWEHLHSDMCELGPLFAVIGVVVAIAWALRGEGSCTLTFAAMLVSYILFFCWRANLDINDPLLRGVVERFWMQADLVVAVLAGIGFHTAVRMCVETLMGDHKISMSSVFTVMGGSIVLALQLSNVYQCNQNGNLIVHDFAKTLLENMPKNAIVFTRGDLPSNTMRYFHLCEGVRPDLQLVDVEVLTYEWSLPMLRHHHPKVNFPGDFWFTTSTLWSDGRRSFDFKSLLDANQNVPLMACIGMQDRDGSWKDSYQLWPYGPCKQIFPISQTFIPAKWANVTGGFADKWQHPFEGFSDTSWEKVANDEMWHAKIGTAFFMYQQADHVKDPKVKAELLRQSYEQYFRAIKVNQLPGKMTILDGFPPFWHKNFALVCERLSHYELEISSPKLCKLSMYHFQLYLQHSPNDKDIGSIHHAIDVLQQRLDTYDKFLAVDRTLGKMQERHEKLEKKQEQNRKEAKQEKENGRKH